MKTKYHNIWIFFSFSWFNLFFFILEKNEQIKKEIKLVKIKAIKIFKYRKNNDRYWNEAKLYNQVVNKTLSIAQIFYSGYSLFFLFNNTICHFIYFKNAL